MPAGDAVNSMRIMFPLAGFLYLAVGLFARFSSSNNSGYITAFIVSIIAIISISIKFFEIYSAWYLSLVLYIGVAFSFLLMKSNVINDKYQKAEQDIEKYNRRIEDIIKSSPFPIIISRVTDDKIILANNNAIKLFGINSQQINQYHLKDFFADSNNRRILLEKIEESKEVQDFEVLIKTASTETPFWLLTSANIIDYNYDVALY